MAEILDINGNKPETKEPEFKESEFDSNGKRPVLVIYETKDQRGYMTFEPKIKALANHATLSEFIRNIAKDMEFTHFVEAASELTIAKLKQLSKQAEDAELIKEISKNLKG